MAFEGAGAASVPAAFCGGVVAFEAVGAAAGLVPLVVGVVVGEVGGGPARRVGVALGVARRAMTGVRLLLAHGAKRNSAVLTVFWN